MSKRPSGKHGSGASTRLVVGRVYTRKDLKGLFNITDASINNGVFRPKGLASIWLFVTEQKTADRTQYVDALVGDTLHWEGQRLGRTDHWVVNHASNGDELLLFHRLRKDQYEGGGFRFEGHFHYVSHKAGRLPTKFVLSRGEA